MNQLISCCGLDCGSCDARLATIQNSDELRKSTAASWQKMFNASITYESINCTGCREEGVKFAHCSTCEIRICVQNKGFQTCVDCEDMATCKIVAMVHQHAPEAINNLMTLFRETK
jgi:hypothetical protein